VHEFGQIPDVADYKGETPLHYAIRHRRAKVVAKLVDELGVYPNAYVAKKVPTPLDMAKSGGLRNIADYLKKMGAKTVKEMEKASGGKSEVTGLAPGMTAMSAVSLTNSSGCSTHSGRTGYSSESTGSSSSRNFVLGTASLMKNKLDELMM
jgi:ankyrin repeat protein